MNDEIVSWDAGTVIYNFNDESDFAYLLKEGEVQIISEKGIKVGFINENEIFGEQSILLDTKRTVTAKATKNSSAIRITKGTLHKEFEKSSILVRAILRSTYIRLMNLDNTIHKDLESLIDKKK